MNVLLLDYDENRRVKVAEALAMVSPDCVVVARRSLKEAEDAMVASRCPFALALVGPDLPENPIPVVRFLRRLSPDTRIAAYDSFGLGDGIRWQRILLAGANMVFDIRMAPLKIALLLRPMLTPVGMAASPSILAA